MNLTLQKDQKNTILNTWRLRISLFILDCKNKLCCHGTRPFRTLETKKHSAKDAETMNPFLSLKI